LSTNGLYNGQTPPPVSPKQTYIKIIRFTMCNSGIFGILTFSLLNNLDTVGRKGTTDLYIQMATILMANLVVVYGVFFLHWNFFMIIYSYWFAEFITSFFGYLKVRMLRQRGELPREVAASDNFFFLFIYWVFIVVLVGFVIAPDKMYGENLKTLLFMNGAFNLSVLVILLGELGAFLQAFVLTRSYQVSDFVHRSKIMNKRMMVMHLSIIVGTFAWFAMYSDNFFFRIEGGQYAEYIFMLVFVAIRFVAELWSLYRQSRLV
jgi:hypothetical protein